ncbi:Potassium voltage-gated channel subfamily KQT member 1 [Frankliniella fusca]|uniref:XK-related protein n=1 Tax=Frankliniella fusca TaxID=407009 RepID=A0AAE1HTE6_9NEOP|nr:Potassium voltage-gated channel subfamily KQT member 1 [Frankliniella fusca]
MELEEDEENTDIKTSVLDRKPIKVFGHELTYKQQMWLGFMVPAFISTIIFLSNFALDAAVAYQLFRFATLLFWSVVALTEEDPQREEALSIIAANHHTELFFFLDSYLNAAPQALLQAYILLSPQIVTTNETGWTLAVSILTSVITMSKTTALYQRFESQRVVGRSAPWDVQSTESHTKSLVQIKTFDPYHLMGLDKSNEEGNQIPVRPKLSLVIDPSPKVHFHQETDQQDDCNEKDQSACSEQNNDQTEEINQREEEEQEINTNEQSEEKVEIEETMKTENGRDDEPKQQEGNHQKIGTGDEENIEKVHDKLTVLER